MFLSEPACVNSTYFMQMCHRHKSTAFYSLTCLFVTSKNSSVALLSLLFWSKDKCLPFRRRKKYLISSLCTCFPNHCPMCFDVLIHVGHVPHKYELFFKYVEPWAISVHALLHQHYISTLGTVVGSRELNCSPISPLSDSSWEWPSGWHHFHPRTATVQLFAIPHPDGWTDRESNLRHDPACMSVDVSSRYRPHSWHLDTEGHVTSQKTVWSFFIMARDLTKSVKDLLLLLHH